MRGSPRSSGDGRLRARRAIRRRHSWPYSASSCSAQNASVISITSAARGRSATGIFSAATSFMVAPSVVGAPGRIPAPSDGGPSRRVAMTLRLTDQQTAALRARADREGRSMQQVAVSALEDYLLRAEDDEQMDRLAAHGAQ